MLQKIYIDDLIDMRHYVNVAPIAVDLVYAQENHPENIFSCALYRKNAPFLLYHTLAQVTLFAAQSLYDDFGWTCVLMDGLRPVEAQKAMQQTAIVKANPHWCETPNRLLSPPGHGGHPRAMAVDIVCLGGDGARIDMGTSFDYLSEDPHYNPAARYFTDLPASVLENRMRLENAMLEAANKKNVALLPLPAEWWDFRFTADVYNQYEPLKDSDLPANMQMCLAQS